MDRELLASKDLGDQGAVRRRAGEIAAEADKGLRAAIQHGADGAQHIVAIFARRLENRTHARQGVQEGNWRLFIDADRAIALHIAVAADRAEAGARPPEIAPQQHEIGDLADRDDRMPVLRHTHRPGADDILGVACRCRPPNRSPCG